MNLQGQCATLGASRPSCRGGSSPPARRRQRWSVGTVLNIARISFPPGCGRPPVRRHFAAQQLSYDQLATSVGALVYLSLTRTLARMGRPGLVAASVACAAACMWPLALARWKPGRRLYVEWRDHLFFFQ